MTNFNPKFPPATVPNEAVWNEEDQEWALGERNAQGDEIGEWKWWLAPNGHLCCHTFFDDHGNILKAKRFHPNGEVSLDLYYDDEGNEVTNYYRSTAATDEYFPDSFFDNDWRAELEVGRSPRHYRYYDRNNHVLSLLEKPIAMDDLKTGPQGETAEQALKRLNQFWDRVEAQLGEELEDLFDELESDHKPVCDDNVTLAQLEKAETRMGITYPPSFKTFVLKHGLIKFGDSWDVDKKLMYPPHCDAIIDEFRNGVTNFEENCSPEIKGRLSQIIPFQNLEFQEGEGYFCFDYSTLNPDTGEVSVVEYHADNMFGVIDDAIEICSGKGFDEHMSTFVDNEIAEILEELEDN